MFVNIILSICFIFSLAVVCRASNDLSEIREDKPYEIIKFKIPLAVWKQAFISPAPLLKTSILASIQENNDTDQTINEPVRPKEDAIVNNTLVNDEVVENPVATSPVVAQAPEVVAAATDEPPQEVSGIVIRYPCTCVAGQCGCCTGSFLERFSMKACGNISFVPEDFVFDVQVSVNNNTLVRNRVSASDPPPICFNPRRTPFVRVCVEISNIRIRNRNAHACLDINVDVGGFSVYSASFRCFSLGASGVQTGLTPLPISAGPQPISLFPNNNNEDAEGGTLFDAAENIFEGPEGIFGEGGNDGPIGDIGEIVGNIFGGRQLD